MWIFSGLTNRECKRDSKEHECEENMKEYECEEDLKEPRYT